MSSSSSATPFEWLPMPSGISLTAHNSFTTDLLRQFDKRRSQLDFDDNISIQKSIHSITVASSPINTPSPSIKKEEEEEESNNRSRSAGDLLRKSSVYLRNKFNDGFHHNTQTVQQIEQPRASTIFNSWTLKKKKKFHIPAQDIFNNNEQPLSKISINTTINISPNNNYATNIDGNNIIQPPVITQYPPKPLKYSPVEPLEDEYAGTATNQQQSQSNRRKTLQRLSLPLLRLTAASQPNRAIQRRRSDSDLLNQQQSSNNNLFHSISKKWNKLLCTCKKRGAKKKNVTL